MPKLILTPKKKRTMVLTPKSKATVTPKARTPYKKTRYTA